MNPITAQQLQNHVEKLASEDKSDRLDYLSFARLTNEVFLILKAEQ
ncbi:MULTISPECIES: hypothetical protein [Methylomicrobium]|uniref:Uncharacterized protein n=1 Tax=Methylomicrobium album BG8 TaxID=686340 RepID=H8GLV4_METAL|nr:MULTISPECIES: hypothetical protein [Methylomicrobium]EIC28150.1 hypothetical protein Metal_0287 [Methylomicrobium album BG8]